MSTAMQQTYMLDHEWEEEPRRLELLQELHDPTSIRRLKRTGVNGGWRCLEVGAGRGSIARWLARQVGPEGSVLAIDLETDLLYGLNEPNVDVLSADVLELDLPAGSLDLIHTRAVLTHIPQRARAIDQMVSWLAPGGWLVLEEIDWLGQVTADRSWSAGMRAYKQATVTIDWECGRELVSELAARGLHDVDADAEIDTIRGATPLADWYGLSMHALRAAVLAARTATNAEIDRQLARLQDPTFRALGFTWIGAWGQRRA